MFIATSRAGLDMIGKLSSQAPDRYAALGTEL
jgi:hypothetical protein